MKICSKNTLLRQKMVQMAKFLPAQAPTGSRLVRNRCKMILINFRYHPILWKFALKCIPGAKGAPYLPLVVGGHISEVHRWIWKFLQFFHSWDLPEHVVNGLDDGRIFVNLNFHLAAQWEVAKVPHSKVTASTLTKSMTWKRLPSSRPSLIRK